MDAKQPLYSLHERIWHWIQAVALILLLLTGFAIHYPARFTLLGDMARAVSWHSGIGLFLILNAFLGLFYHLTAEKYHHYLPRMDDFSEGAIRQARFYLYGIFKGEPHPYEADARHKLNPLQKLTYLALLNILLPFQIVTGALMWGVNRWPETFVRAGGLKVLAPAHTLGSYLFASFLIAHLYLSTTGKTPLGLLRAMITGWEEPEEGRRFAEEIRETSKGAPESAPPEDGAPATLTEGTVP
jgi:thiosulfate reductase cytochrome b subunit